MVAHNYSTLYIPERELSIDEAMVGFKRKSALKQYLPLNLLNVDTKSGVCVNLNLATS